MNRISSTVFSVYLAAVGSAYAKGKPEFPPGQGVSLRVSLETVPVGAVAQIKVSLTEPKPIIKTKLALDGLDEGSLEILGISLYSPRGESWGVARYHGGALTVEATSPTGDLGRSPDYPILTIAVRVKAMGARGFFPIRLDLQKSTFFDRLGVPYPAEVKSGGIAVGGTLAIDNVLPGGGTVQAMKVFQITGHGFRNLTRVQIEGVERLGYEVKSDELLELFSPAPFSLDGAEIKVRNTLDEQVQYFSYLRPKLEAPVNPSFLDSVVPLLPPLDLEAFELRDVETREGSYFAVALENAGQEDLEATLSLDDTTAQNTGAVVLKVPPYSRVVRSFPQMFQGAVVGEGSTMRITSTRPLRGMGLRVNEAESILVPSAPVY